MAFLSAIAGALGSSSFDPLGSYVNSEIQSHYGRKNAEFGTGLSISSARQLALEQPTWKRQGYEAAGFNPILAINDGSFAQPVTTNMAMPDSQSGSMASGMLQPAFGSVAAALGIVGAVANLRKEQADSRAAVAESRAREAKADYEFNLFSARNSAFYRGLPVEGDGKSVNVVNDEHIGNIRKGELDRESLLSEKYLRDTIKFAIEQGASVSDVLKSVFGGGKFSTASGIGSLLKK